MAEAKLALVESLIASEQTADSARRALEWLSRHGGGKQGLCLVIGEDAKRLVGVAGYGLTNDQVFDYTVDLEERDHPLVKVLSAPEPVYFGRGSKPASTPLTSSFLAVPLRSRTIKRHEPSSGLLLITSPSATVAPDIVWVAEVLGERIVHQQAAQLMAERRFSKERTFLHSIINAVTDPILLTDMEGKLLVANARAEKLLLAKEDESEGRRRAIALNNMLFSAALSSKAMEHAEPARNELLLVDPTEGSDLLFELLSSVVQEPGGETGIVSVLRNVTDLGRATQEIGENVRKLRQAQAEMKSERHRMDLILDSVADPIVVTDAVGDIVLMNPPAERLFTVPENGSDEAQRRVRANDAHFSSFVSNLLFIGDDLKWRGEINLTDPVSGEGMPVEAISGKILSDRGELTTVVTILHDRREAIEKALLYEQLKQASLELENKVQGATAELANQNELLRRQAVELEQASAAKSQFLANMSHEFRTPLNAILGYTNMLLQGVAGPLSDQQKKSLSRVDSNGRHLLEVINEILDITRIEAGRMPLNLSTFKLPELFSEVMSELEPIMARSKVKVQTKVKAGVPEIRSDRQKVKQIMVNLLSNALKFTHEGSIRIACTYEGKAGLVSIEVKDTGIGIAAEDHEKVFEDFKQVDNSPTRAYGGTGLGLSICRRLAHMLDGRITLESELGKGSTFTLHIPRRAKR
jgi:PAS domain S-box-containing protein